MQTAPLRATINSLLSALQLQVLIWPCTGDVELNVEASPVQLVPFALLWLSKKSRVLLPGVVSAKCPLTVLRVNVATPAAHMVRQNSTRQY